jgi:hypothetical protein
MAELFVILKELGLDQYLEGFVSNGFDCWGIILDITEADLYG